MPCSNLCFLATVTIGCSGRNLLFLNCFLLSLKVPYVQHCCGTVSVCQFFFGEFLSTLSETGMISFCGCTAT